MSPVSAHRAAWLVVLAGGVAALQVGKLPPALPALQAELGLTLVQSGFLLSMVQLAGMSLAVFMGLLADGMGLKRSMVRGLCLLALASGLGAFATSTAALLALRAIEGLGFLLVALPAPALIRRLVPPAQLSGMPNQPFFVVSVEKVAPTSVTDGSPHFRRISHVPSVAAKSPSAATTRSSPSSVRISGGAE